MPGGGDGAAGVGAQAEELAQEGRRLHREPGARWRRSPIGQIPDGFRLNEQGPHNDRGFAILLEPDPQEQALLERIKACPGVSLRKLRALLTAEGYRRLPELLALVPVALEVRESMGTTRDGEVVGLGPEAVGARAERCLPAGRAQQA